MIRIITFAALIAVAFAGSLDTSDCSGSDKGLGQILEVYCEKFADYDDVILKRGETYEFGIRFIAGVASAGMTPTIFGVIGGISVPWSGVDKDSCGNLGSGVNKCPLVAGKEYHYKASIKILTTYPAVSLTFQWGLTSTDASGAKGSNQVCFRMPAKITT